MIRNIAGYCLALICCSLLALDTWGEISPPDFREHFERPTISYEEALARLDEAWAQHGASKPFVADATKIYNEASVYAWPAGLSRVAYRDNWILGIAAYLDPVLEDFGLSRRGSAHFTQFESFRYERAFRRGFGICSQQAVGFADLLHRRFDIDVFVVGLGGHVLTAVDLPDGSEVLADPSIGVSQPYSLSYAQSHLDKVKAEYAAVGYGALARPYRHKEVFRAQTPGAAPYAPPIWKQWLMIYFERTSDVLIWAVPIAGLFFLLIKLRSTFHLGVSQIYEADTQKFRAESTPRNFK